MKYSAVVPVYKVDYEFLRKCIMSLVKQDYKNLEIILVDDGSPDDCGSICDEYKKKYSNIKVIHQKNKGLSGARNAGINACTGDYITFLDGDDWLEANTFSDLNKKIDLNADVICFGTIKDFNNKSFNYNFNGHFEDGKVYSGKEVNYMLSQLLCFDSYLGDATAKLFKRSLLIEKSLLFDEILKQGIEGLDFNFRVFNECDSIQFVEEFKYHYTYSSESITMKFNEQNYALIIQGFNKIKKIILDNNIYDYDIMYNYYNRIYYFIVTTAISGYFRPKNTLKYREKKEKFNKFMEQEFILDALEKSYYKNIDFKRKIILFLIRKKCYLVLNLFGWLRWVQKNI